jgi:predicted neuraminidase
LLVLLWVPVLYSAEFVFETAPFPSCHASTLVQLKNGDLMAAWFGGTAEGRPDVAIWSSTRKGTAWSAPVELVREPQIAAFNPVLFYTKDGKLWHYYKFGAHPTSWSAGRMRSEDDGRTWSKPEHLPAGLYGPIRAKPLVLDNGTIVSGTSVESYRSWSVWIERSTDHGRTWTKVGPVVVDPRHAGDGQPKYTSSSSEWDLTEGIIQPSIVRLGGKRLRLYARSTSKTGRICVADSNDLGVTWTQARPIELPNPNSGIDADTLPDGRVVLVYNHTMKGRSPLNLAVSKDGERFEMFQTLENEPGEFSYPSMIVGRDAALHITYTWNRKRIKYVRVPIDKAR